MLQSIFDFFMQLFYVEFEGDPLLNEMYFNVGFNGASPYTLDFATYLSLICSFISLIFIIVLCCLFVYKLVRLVGGLFRR